MSLEKRGNQVLSVRDRSQLERVETEQLSSFGWSQCD